MQTAEEREINSPKQGEEMTYMLSPPSVFNGKVKEMPGIKRFIPRCIIKTNRMNKIQIEQ